MRLCIQHVRTYMDEQRLFLARTLQHLDQLFRTNLSRSWNRSLLGAHLNAQGVDRYEADQANFRNHGHEFHGLCLNEKNSDVTSSMNSGPRPSPLIAHFG